MITILADHDIEGYAYSIMGVLAAEGWLEIVELKLATFAETGLPFDSSDRTVWHFAQANGLILLTQSVA